MRRRLAGMAVGAVAIALLLLLVPAPVFAITQSVLYAAAALVLLWVAIALFVVPARQALSDVFVLGLREQRGALFGGVREDEQRLVLRPLVVGAVCAGVAALSSLLR